MVFFIRTYLYPKETYYHNIDLLPKDKNIHFKNYYPVQGTGNCIFHLFTQITGGVIHFLSQIMIRVKLSFEISIRYTVLHSTCTWYGTVNCTIHEYFQFIQHNLLSKKRCIINNDNLIYFITFSSYLKKLF